MRKTTDLILLLLLAATLLAGPGCAAGSGPRDSGDVLFVLPGAGGDGQWRRNIVNGLRDAGFDQRVEIVRWGAPLPLFMFNFQSTGIHERAEGKLAGRIERWRRDHPDGRITLIGHSAGAGVVLGALGQLPDGVRVERALLLAPSVSPGYDLAPALARIDEQLHVFHSTGDSFFLKWRTGTFGTYDNVRTPAAGHLGFQLADDVPAELVLRLTQHPYDPQWRTLRNNGRHFGATARPFVRDVLASLVMP